MSQTTPKSTPVTKQDEKILVVPARKLFSSNSINGFHPLKDFDFYANLIATNKEFLWRSDMEQDATYKQIIPYLIFTYNDKYFLMQRRGSASEQRLKNKRTLGIGGHIREDDIAGKDIIDWAKREFHEEVNYDGTLDVEILGLINDESNEVGMVHTGFAFLLKGNNPNISIRSELKEGHLLTLEECAEYYDAMETWTQLVFNFLQQRTQG
ncbi:NUDIX domain-containing protein [Candidatus Babeliales bacterium]|nr:NUDIX domain-containing protein [Candidatus Babeliales bacterium]